MDIVALAVLTVVLGAFVFFVMRADREPTGAIESLARSIPGSLLHTDRWGLVFENAGRRVELRFDTERKARDRYFDLVLDLGDLPQIPIAISREDLLGKLDKALLNEELKVGIPSFDKRFIVHSGRPESAMRFLTPEVCTAIERLASFAKRDAICICDRPRVLRIYFWGWERDPERLERIVEASRTVFDGYLAAAELEPKPEPKKKLLEVLPDACVVCQGKLDGEPISCRWCGALYHPGCQPESGICGACGSQMRERGEG